MKYLVIATKWDDNAKAQLKYVAGEFPTYHLAAMFRDAYNDHYKADAEVIETKR
jgi:hypothetical protein